MESERRSTPSTERRRRRTHAPAARSVSPELDRRGHHIGPLWLTISPLCRRWQLSRKTIYKFIDARILPAWKVGSHLYRVAVEDVLRFEGQVPNLRSDRVSVPTKD
jgi:excisionase family DNA binding protein